MLNPDQFPQLEIPYEKVLTRLGYARGTTTLDPRTEELINKEIERSRKLISARQVIASSKVSLTSAGIIDLSPGLTIKSAKIYELLKDCTQAYGFAVTIGPHLEEKRRLLLEDKNTSRALILDAIGSVMAEELAQITNDQIKKDAAAIGLTTTRRFSPGYGDWAISGQKDFLTWLGAEKIGIKLTDKFQMLPEKSVSAIIGIIK